MVCRAKIDGNMEDVSDKITLAHISDTVGRLAESQQRIESKLDPESDDYILTGINSQIRPLVEVYDGALFVRKFVLGLASVIVALGMIGAGVIWLINYIRHG